MKLLVAFLVSLSCAAPAIAEPTIKGRASVIDGDTIEIAGQRIRFDGIDAPESWQSCKDENGKAYRCGKAAADALDAFLSASRPTACTVSGFDRYERAVAECYRADGEPVNSWLVKNGYALDWPRYSNGRYAAEQRAAQAARVGVWKGDFLMPCIARAERDNRKPAC